MALYAKFLAKKYKDVILEIARNGQDVMTLEWEKVKGNPKLAAKTSFSSTEEYLATIAMGAKIAQTITEYEQGFIFNNCRIRILRQKDHGMIAVVELPLWHREKLAKKKTNTISPGDRGFLCLEYDATTEKGSFHVKVRFQMDFIEPFPSSPQGILAAKLKPRQKRPKSSNSDTSLGKDEDQPDFVVRPSYDGLHNTLNHKATMAFVHDTIPHIEVPRSVQGPDNVISYIMKRRPIMGGVDTVDRHSEFVYVYQSMSRIHPNLQEWLAAGPKMRAPRLDIYSPLDDKSLVDSDHLQLNQSQRAALEMGRSALGGFVIAHGGPGTGKTHFIVQAVKPFFLDKKPHKVLITSAGNRGADSIALELNNWLQSLDPGVRGDSYLVRLHSVKTETNIFLKDAENAKREALSNMAKKTADTSQQKEGSQEKNDPIYNHYRTYACGRFKGVDDDRVQHISLSVGMIMKQRLSTNPELQHKYDQYSKGEIYGDEEVQCFIRQVHDFMGKIIGRATAVCATVAGVADPLVRLNYIMSELIVVDEAARVPEYQWWPLLGFYKHAQGKIMVGDPLQMEPAAGHLDKESPLRNQNAHSLQGRLQARGLQAGFFDTQYRAVPEIARIYNKTRYQGRLKSGEEALVENRPLAQAIVKHNEEKYGTKHSVVFFDVQGATERKDTKKALPKICDEYIVAVTSILEDLINAGFGSSAHPATIAVLTPYRLEYKRLRYARTKMGDDYPQAADIVIETVDKIQGMEYDIVIIDPVMTHNAGFLTFRRLNVLFSRARSGLYVLGCVASWKSLFKTVTDSSDYAYPLKKFAEQLDPYIKRFPVETDNICLSSNKYYDPGEFEQVPEMSTTPEDIRKALLNMQEAKDKKISEESQMKKLEQPKVVDKIEKKEVVEGS
ncbi:DNA helicase [Apiospora arundinis]|uniref:DNA helicase n=1 Tax=Apiospora arundinis TaxID=335852 RepID=A0ABR2JDD4_9PEZI